jgi:hypothetical protein
MRLCTLVSLLCLISLFVQIPNEPAKQQQTTVVDGDDDELHKFGIFYDDHYDYMQHLRPLKQIAVLAPLDMSQTTKKSAAVSKVRYILFFI